MSRTLHLFGTDWGAMMVPIQVIRWYRFMRYSGTDSPILSAKVLHRESDGLTLYVRKLSEGRFQMPHFNNDNRTTTLTPDEFTLLILGEKWYEETPSEN